jgi:FixJ family two-component response regulator
LEEPTAVRFARALHHCWRESETDAEPDAAEGYNRKAAARILSEISERDREVLRSFYVEGQPPSKICREMDVTEAEFQLIKSSAKARFAKLTRPSAIDKRLDRGRRARAGDAPARDAAPVHATETAATPAEKPLETNRD